ncbi:hypothetical protein Tco_1058301 [Tanacetum coccineum]|uniref:Uncharacterized protein n=1 Tax=Tanacetum coccineum TaxID=301880 RepID=A0ABQ5H8K0_9ASTR
MTTTAAQQAAIDNALVPLEKRVKISKYNMRINPEKTQKEPTYQFVLDALALTTCYPDHCRCSRDLYASVLICLKLPNQEFRALPSDEEIMYQSWRTFAAIINKCLSGKITSLDKLRLSRAQILWGMFYKKNVDFVKLLWEDFTFQIEIRDHKKQENMYYSRFTKAIIHHFITKDKLISMRNKMFMHTAEDDIILCPLRFVSKYDDYQVYGALLHEVMTNQKMRDSPAYKTYLIFATGTTSLKKVREFKKPASPLRKGTLVTIEEEEHEPAKKVKKAPTTTDRSKGIDLLSEAALLEEAQVPNEPKGKSIDTHEGTSLKPGVTNVSKTDSSESEYESWGNSGDEANEQGYDKDVCKSNDDHEQADDERTNSENQETNDDDEDSDNEFVHTPEDYVPTDDETNDESKDVNEEEYDRIDKELYSDVNVRLTDVKQYDKGKDDADMTDVEHVRMWNKQQQLLLLPYKMLLLRMADLEKDVKELKDVDNSTKVISKIKSEVPNAVKEYLGSSLDDALHKVIQRNFANIIKEHIVPYEIIKRLRQQYAPQKSIEDIREIKMEHARKQQVPKETITSSDTTTHEEFD